MKLGEILWLSQNTQEISGWFRIQIEIIPVSEFLQIQ